MSHSEGFTVCAEFSAPFLCETSFSWLEKNKKIKKRGITSWEGFQEVGVQSLQTWKDREGKQDEQMHFQTLIVPLSALHLSNHNLFLSSAPLPPSSPSNARKVCLFFSCWRRRDEALIWGFMKTPQRRRYGGIHPPIKKSAFSWNSFWIHYWCTFKKEECGGGGGGGGGRTDTFGGAQTGLPGNPSSEDTPDSSCAVYAPHHTPTRNTHTHVPTRVGMPCTLARTLNINHTFRNKDPSHFPDKTLSSPNYVIAQMVLLQTRRLW